MRGKLMAWERPLRKADFAALGDSAPGRSPGSLRSCPPDGDILGVRVPDEGVKLALIADEPDIFFTTPHFDGYPMVLVQLDRIGVDELRELVTEAWLCHAPKRLAREFLDGSA